MRCIRTETGRWVETRDGLLPLPGAYHPALEKVVESVRSSELEEMRIVLPRKISVFEDFDAVFDEVIVTRSLAIYPDWWGIWTWKIWTDDIGRMLAAYEVSWVQRELFQPEFAYAPFVRAPYPHP